MKANETVRCVLGYMLLCAVAAASADDAPKCTFNFTDVHANKTAKETDSYAVNNKGVIAGDYIDSAGVQHGMILDGTKLTTVDKKNCGPSITSNAINDEDVAAGYCFSTKTQQYEGFTYDKGKKKFTAVSFPNSFGTVAEGINDKGDVVGLYFDSAGNTHGFVEKGGNYKSIDVKGAQNTWANGINNEGWAVLVTSPTPWTCGPLSCDGYLLKGKKLIPVKDPNDGIWGNNVNAINNKGDIVGVYWDSNSNRVGFLLHGSKYCDVKDPKADNSTRADGINDKLEIVGRYSPASEANVGFKAIPQQ